MIATSGFSELARSSAWSASSAIATLYPSMRRSVSRITRQARSSSTTRIVEPRRSSGIGAIGLGGVNGKGYVAQYIGDHVQPSPQAVVSSHPGKAGQTA